MTSIFNELDKLDIQEEEKIKFINQITYSNTYSDLIYLLKEEKYEVRALIKYLLEYLAPFENLEEREAIELLKDYYFMAKAIGRDIKKYPKYLKSIHDIITSNFNAFEKEYDEVLFRNLAKEELEFEDKIYCVIVPKSSKELISEGVANNNCVSSYIDKILRGETYLMFMRKTDLKEISLITLEFKNNELVQYKGAYNRLPDEKEMEFIEKYCKIKDIKLNTKGG